MSQVHTRETKQKISKALKGRKLSLETKTKISLAKKNISRETRLKMSLAKRNKPTHIWSEESRRKVAQSLLGRVSSLKNKPWTEKRRQAYLMGVFLHKKKAYESKGKIYCDSWYELRKKIYERDHWTCQECGIKCQIHGKKKIQCHHINYDVTNNCFSNLITLCASCHAKTNYTREDWKNHFHNKFRLSGSLNHSNRLVKDVKKEVLNNEGR